MHSKVPYCEFDLQNFGWLYPIRFGTSRYPKCLRIKSWALSPISVVPLLSRYKSVITLRTIPMTTNVDNDDPEYHVTKNGLVCGVMNS